MASNKTNSWLSSKEIMLTFWEGYFILCRPIREIRLSKNNSHALHKVITQSVVLVIISTGC